VGLHPIPLFPASSAPSLVHPVDQCEQRTYCHNSSDDEVVLQAQVREAQGG
jgi:hypothetical protein